MKKDFAISQSSQPVRPLPWKVIAIVSMIIAVLAIGVAVGGMFGGTGGQPNANPNGAEQIEPTEAVTEPSLRQFARLDPGDPFALGDVNAPIVIIEYADFTCPYCGAFAVNSFPTILEKYVEQGLVRFEWRDAPVLTQYSSSVAIAGRAAAEQGLFWEFYDVMFAYTYEGDRDFSVENVLAIAGSIPGLDIARFQADLSNPELIEAVEQEEFASRSVGVTAVPTFIVGEEVVQGAQPVEIFQQLIDQQLQEMG